MDYINNLSSSQDPSSGMTASTMGELMGVVLNILMGSAIAISVISTGIAGIKYITSKSDPKARDSAKNALTYAVIASILAIGAFAVKLAVLSAFGANGVITNGVPNF